MHPSHGGGFDAELRACTAELAEITFADPDRAVPTCPDWNFRQLATHVGRGHRWAAHIVTSRSTEPVAPRDVPGGKLPDDPALREQWLNDSAAEIIDAVAAADDAPVWTFIGPRPASFWARRRAHEVAVHLADAQLAAGREVVLAPAFAADGVAEWLEILTASAQGATSPVRTQATELRGDGQTLHFHATDPGLADAGEWLITRTPSGITVRQGHGRADVAVRAPAVSLLLVLTRRVPLEDPAVELHGDRGLITHWLEHTPF